MEGPDDPHCGWLRDLTDLLWIKAEGELFVVAGLLAASLLLVERPSLLGAVPLLICVWSFCRAYYFAFYVLGRYVDPGYKFSGLWPLMRYWWRKEK